MYSYLYDSQFTNTLNDKWVSVTTNSKKPGFDPRQLGKPIPQDDVSNIGHAHWTLYVRTIDPTQQDINQFQSKQKKRSKFPGRYELMC